MKDNTIEIDEVELYLNILQIRCPEQVKGKTYKELAELISAKFQVNCKEEDVFIVHEPTIEEMEEDYRCMYNNLY